MSDIVAVQLTREDWKSPLVLDYEGLSVRLGPLAAENVWDKCARYGEFQMAGTTYRRMVPLIDRE